MNDTSEQFNSKYIENLKRVDLNSALYFLSVVNYRTVFNASLVLNCSPPTVSVMLKRFCSYFPVPLFEREGRTLTPTRFGRELYKRIVEIYCVIGDVFYDEE